MVNLSRTCWSNIAGQYSLLLEYKICKRQVMRSILNRASKKRLFIFFCFLNYSFRFVFMIFGFISLWSFRFFLSVFFAACPFRFQFFHVALAGASPGFRNGTPQKRKTKDSIRLSHFRWCFFVLFDFSFFLP